MSGTNKMSEVITPGEWVARDAIFSHFVSSNGEHIAEVKRAEDASLIAAAPDLLAALETLLSVHDRDVSDFFVGCATSEARAAIAKANGKPCPDVATLDAIVEANARLIAAAPDLLEAAKNVCGLLFSLENVPDDHPAYQALKVVIAKATGDK